VGGKAEDQDHRLSADQEDSARVSALLAGEIDLAFDVPPELIPLVERAGKTKIKRALSVRTFFLFLNTINAAYPTTKREVREAINYAIDRESLNKNILGSTGAPAAWLNPNTFGINPSSSRFRTIPRARSSCWRRPAIPTASTWCSTRSRAASSRTRSWPKRSPAS